MPLAKNETSAATWHSEQARWTAVAERERAADEHFFYAVETTGIYCYPSCAARLPNRSNVSFFDTRLEAERAGFRSCQRCGSATPPPAVREAQLIVRLCRELELAEREPTLTELGRLAGLSPGRVQRLFKSAVGLTPKAYAKAKRLERVKAQLANGSASVTRAMHEAGYNSSGRFYEDAAKTLGMKPNEYRKGGEGREIAFAVEKCSLGLVLVGATSKGLCSVLLGASRKALLKELEQRFPRARRQPAASKLQRFVEQIVQQIEQPTRTGVQLPLDIAGTAFQHRVWQALRNIPAGELRSYHQVATSIGRPSSFRAVATACAQNPAAIAVPCHRVVRKNGDLSGYRWGIERKRELLEREAAVTAPSRPKRPEQ